MSIVSTVIRPLLERLSATVTSPAIASQAAHFGITALAARLAELEETVPAVEAALLELAERRGQLETQCDELVGEATRLSDLIAERREQLAGLDDDVSERLAELGEPDVTPAQEAGSSRRLGELLDAALEGTDAAGLVVAPRRPLREPLAT